jgi:hypothetical protein
MTEDDTFNALRRNSFESVLKELGSKAGTPRDLHITKNIWSCDNDNLSPHWLDFFRVRGWTIAEFEEECKK